MDLKNKIKSYGFSLAEIGEKIGVSKSGMTTIVNGNPTLSTLQAVANACNVSLSELLQEEETPIFEEITINGKRYKLVPFSEKE